jgi:urea transport system permease protein
MGGLTLLSPATRRRATTPRRRCSNREASILPTLETAIAKEQDPGVKRVMLQARAAIILSSADASDRGQARRRDIIRSAATRTRSDCCRACRRDTSAPVLKAAAAAIPRSRTVSSCGKAVQNAWYGISLGSVLLLAAIGLAITFGVMGVINMAHGEMVMLGAYVTFVVQELIRNNNPALFDYSLAIAIPLAFLVAGCIGIVIERTIIRFLYGRPLETLLATWGFR